MSYVESDLLLLLLLLLILILILILILPMAMIMVVATVDTVWAECRVVRMCSTRSSQSCRM